MAKLNFKKINYKTLNARQQENYNFHKLAAVLADYGYTTIRLSDDWQAADCIAVHRNGKSLRIQLKGRFVIDKKYIGKDLWICFPYHDHGEWYLYPHDEILKELEKNDKSFKFYAWFKGSGGFSSGKLSRALVNLLERYKI
ncbi:MAG: hypothetical protein WAU28_04430 [Candidatus Moraniibacteriota bacterium]